jgi:archaeal flagellar protein FlaI
MTKMDPDEEKQLLENNPHLKKYVENISLKMSKPTFCVKIPKEEKGNKFPNLIYPTKGIVFIHIFRTPEMEQIEYHAIEPNLTKDQIKKRNEVLERMYEQAHFYADIKSPEDLRKAISTLLDKITVIDESATEFNKEKNRRKIALTSEDKISIKYDITKEIVGGGPLEPLMRDPNIEDIHILTGEDVHLIHKVFDLVRTNIYIDPDWANAFSQDFSEKIGSPVSDGVPIADGTLPDGSRVNIIHPDDVSLKGPSMTVRKFSETPISITQIINWGTMSSYIAAYIWIAMQYGRSFFVCGETASGKTTTTNAVIPFIPPDRKIYSAENTPEVQVPHPVWQQLLTRTTGPKESHVDLNDLLKAALRSRPNYIIPGETRGIEGRVVFQAMQTGHPCITTFHAGSVTKVIQRFTGDPIRIPKPFMDNLDFVIIQLAVDRKGKRLRRVISVDEIEGYNSAVDGVITRKAFEWNSAADQHLFKANRNSYILEERIAKTAGYENPTDIYNELDLRKRILDRMIEEKIFDYYEVVQFIWTYFREGVDGLPITI